MNSKTDVSHWDQVWRESPRGDLGFLSSATISRRRILQKHASPGVSILEIGCAPGLMLNYLRDRGTTISGLDYSEEGVRRTRKLLGKADIRCEDVFHTSFTEASFDLVYSQGVIEHFDDPREIVEQHVKLTKFGGKTVILIPNYGGIYGKLQDWLDPKNLEIHNLRIMKPDALVEFGGIAYPAGTITPEILSLSAKLPRLLSWPLWGVLNVAGLVQPVKIKPLCPFMVLEISR